MAGAGAGRRGVGDSYPGILNLEGTAASVDVRAIEGRLRLLGTLNGLERGQGLRSPPPIQRNAPTRELVAPTAEHRDPAKDAKRFAVAARLCSRRLRICSSAVSLTGAAVMTG